MSELVDFPTKASADAIREEYDEWLCPVDDDKRTTTVAFVSDTPDGVIDAAVSESMDAQGEQSRSNTAALSDGERERISDLDGFGRKVTTKNWESAKGVFEREGMGGRFWDAMGALTDYDDPAEGAEAWVSDARENATGGQGGKHDVGEEDLRQEQRAAEAGRRARGQGCDHAHGYCEAGDPEACEHLKEVCGYSQEEVNELFADTTDDDGGETEQSDLVTVGGGEYSEMEVTPGEASALKESWGGYKGATADLRDALDTVAKAVPEARRAWKAINAIREEHGEAPIESHKLDNELAALADLPGSIPEVRTLNEFIESDDADDDRARFEGFDGDPLVRRSDVRGATNGGEESTSKREEVESEAPDPLAPGWPLRSVSVGPVVSWDSPESGPGKVEARSTEDGWAVVRVETDPDEGIRYIDVGETDTFADAVEEARGAVDPIPERVRSMEHTDDPLRRRDLAARRRARDEVERRDRLRSAKFQTFNGEPRVRRGDVRGESRPVPDYSMDVQSDLGGEGVEQRQATLAGEDADDPKNGALPATWKDEGHRLVAGPYSIIIEPIEGYRTWDVELLGPDGLRFSVATDVPTQETAREIATTFAELTPPPDVSFHKSDGILPESAAEAKQSVEYEKRGNAGLDDYE